MFLDYLLSGKDNWIEILWWFYIKHPRFCQKSIYWSGETNFPSFLGDSLLVGNQISRCCKTTLKKKTTTTYISRRHHWYFGETSGGLNRVMSAVFSVWYRLLPLPSPRTAGSQAFSVNAFPLRIPETHRPRRIMRPWDQARRVDLPDSHPQTLGFFLAKKWVFSSG